MGRRVHVSIRLEEHKLCLLVMIGVRADGRKELIALADGYRESTESWADAPGLTLSAVCWSSVMISKAGRHERHRNRDPRRECEHA